MTTTVDATVLTDALLKVGTPAAVAARAAMNGAAVMGYALKEVRHGPFGNFVYAHEVLVAEGTYTAAMARIECVAQQRYKQRTALEALRVALTEVLGEDAEAMGSTLRTAAQEMGGGPTVDEIMARQTAGVLARVLWSAHAEMLTLAASATDALTCFVMHPLRRRRDGSIDDGVRKCPQACALGGLLAARGADVNALIGVVAGLQTKPENVHRLEALQWVAANPGASPSIDYCRALGDAVYALLCPAGGTVVTTNLADHAPLTNALGKHAKAP